MVGLKTIIDFLDWINVLTREFTLAVLSEMSLLQLLTVSPYYPMTAHVRVMINEWNQRHLWAGPRDSTRRTAAQMQASIYLPNAPFNSLPDR